FGGPEFYEYTALSHTQLSSRPSASSAFTRVFDALWRESQDPLPSSAARSMFLPCQEPFSRTVYFRKLTILLCLDASLANDFPPLFSFVRDELAKIGRRARQQHAADIGEPRLDRRIGEACI